MEYKISVVHSSPVGIIALLEYYDTSLGVTLSRRSEDGEAVLRILRSANNSVGADFRMEMDESGEVHEFVIQDGTKVKTTRPIVIVETKAKTVSQEELLRHISDILTTL